MLIVIIVLCHLGELRYWKIYIATGRIWQKRVEQGIFRIGPVGVTTPAASIWAWVVYFSIWRLLLGRNCQISISNEFGISATSTIVIMLGSMAFTFYWPPFHVDMEFGGQLRVYNLDHYIRQLN